MTNEELERAVSAELYWDPKIHNQKIAVSAADGVVTLRGTVGSFREKNDAGHAAQRVRGVAGVENKLEVHLFSDQRRDDADLRDAVLQALALDSLVPDTVEVKVRDGRVTLSGSVDWQYQRQEAYTVASRIAGVYEVTENIDLKRTVPAADVKRAIGDAFQRSARLDANQITVETTGGTVRLEGTVPSWAEHDEAVSAAWSAPGVTDVDDRLVVLY